MIHSWGMSFGPAFSSAASDCSMSRRAAQAAVAISSALVRRISAIAESAPRRPARPAACSPVPRR